MQLTGESFELCPELFEVNGLPALLRAEVGGRIAGHLNEVLQMDALGARIPARILPDLDETNGRLLVLNYGGEQHHHFGRVAGGDALEDAGAAERLEQDRLGGLERLPQQLVVALPAILVVVEPNAIDVDLALELQEALRILQ